MIFLHRDRDTETNRLQERTAFVVAKNRDGETGMVNARFEASTMRFSASGVRGAA